MKRPLVDDWVTLVDPVDAPDSCKKSAWHGRANRRAQKRLKRRFRGRTRWSTRVACHAGKKGEVWTCCSSEVFDDYLEEDELAKEKKEEEEKRKKWVAEIKATMAARRPALP